MMDVLDLLKHQALFADLKETERALIAAQSNERTYRGGEIITLSGHPWPYLFLVGEGGVQAHKISSEGRNLLVATFQPGDLFWGLAFFREQAPMPVMLQAQPACRLYLWSRDRLVPILLRHARMAWELCRMMAGQMLRASALVEEQTFYPVEARLARMLLNSFESTGEQPVARSLTLDEMAARIGSTRETVCRTLHRLAEIHLIDVTRTELTLVDKPGLSELADKK